MNHTIYEVAEAVSSKLASVQLNATSIVSFPDGYYWQGERRALNSQGTPQGRPGGVRTVEKTMSVVSIELTPSSNQPTRDQFLG